MKDDYRLLDVGGERRLEQFGTRIVDRPQPGEIGSPLTPGAWPSADLRFERRGGWHGLPEVLDPWQIPVDGLLLELRPTGSGQVGLFPEHLASLDWLRAQVASIVASGVTAAGRAGAHEDTSDDSYEGWRGHGTSRPTILNLFGSTGLASLALAQAGAAVVHVDASRPAVTWARRNAELSGLADRPIRWIVDEAATFVAREVRRGRRYDGVILDPPTYGHGNGGRAWRFEDDLTELLVGCAALTPGPGSFCLLTSHTLGHAADRIAGLLARAFRRPPAAVGAGEMGIDAASGARLELGAFARLTR